ncbi:MAG: FprA family A-type flavoprotein, partial [Endomicrobiia bacterium]|nr:FprA family A-type flavoprotein [Endomicrobiia bacterium]
MKSIKILDNLHWVGAVDWDAREFHGHSYSVHRGTTYNAYLIIDEKIALVDSVHTPFSDELLARVSSLI